MPCLLPPLTLRNRGGGSGRQRRPSPAALGRRGGREEGEKGPGGARSRSPSPISEEGPRRERCGSRGHGGRAAATGSAGGGSSERELVGKREREERGLHPPVHLGRKRLEEVARLGPVEGGGGECGGGAAGRGAGGADSGGRRAARRAFNGVRPRSRVAERRTGSEAAQE